MNLFMNFSSGSRAISTISLISPKEQKGERIKNEQF